MPILRENTEFAYKWASLSESHVNEGIREPVKAYEYMNEFYIEEGNKRVSVLKYYDAVSVPGIVTRILPRGQKRRKIKFITNLWIFMNCRKSIISGFQN